MIEDITEFVGQIIDVFEDFLEEKGVRLHVDTDVCVYGTDYDKLQNSIEDILREWKIAE